MDFLVIQTKALPDLLTIRTRSLTIEDIEAVARHETLVELSSAVRSRAEKGRAWLEKRRAAGETIYGINTGVGGNAVFLLSAEQTELFQHNIIRQLSRATGDPLPEEVVRASLVVRLATFAKGASSVRWELVETLAGLLNHHITPVVPRYGSVGASGDLIPSAYTARTLLGLGEVTSKGQTRPASGALQAAGLQPLRFAPKEALALINGTTLMTSAAVLLWVDAGRVVRAVLSAVALALQALQSQTEPYQPWIHDANGHPGQIAVAAHIRRLLQGNRLTQESTTQSCYSLRCVPQGLGPVWESLDDARQLIEREINAGDDNPLADIETGDPYQAGNFYGGHIARFLDALKLDFAVMANWNNALIAVLVDETSNRGLPANLVPDPGLNSGLKWMQLSATSLACAVRQMAGPSSIHSLPTEQYDQDVVSLGMHAAVTALDALRCLRDQTAMVLLAAAQAVELRGAPDGLGQASQRDHETIRQVAALLEKDRPMDREIEQLSTSIAHGAFD